MNSDYHIRAHPPTEIMSRDWRLTFSCFDVHGVGHNVLQFHELQLGPGFLAIRSHHRILLVAVSVTVFVPLRPRIQLFRSFSILVSSCLQNGCVVRIHWLLFKAQVTEKDVQEHNPPVKKGSRRRVTRQSELLIRGSSGLAEYVILFLRLGPHVFPPFLARGF